MTIPVLKVINSDSIEIAIDEHKGLSFITDNGYTKISGVTREQIEQRFSLLKQQNPKFQVSTVSTINSNGCTLNYLLPPGLAFKWLLLDNIEIALELGMIGVKAFIAAQVEQLDDFADPDVTEFD